jgi:hypothetical protein
MKCVCRKIHADFVHLGDELRFHVTVEITVTVNDDRSSAQGKTSSSANQTEGNSGVAAREKSLRSAAGAEFRPPHLPLAVRFLRRFRFDCFSSGISYKNSICFG